MPARELHEDIFQTCLPCREMNELRGCLCTSASSAGMVSCGSFTCSEIQTISVRTDCTPGSYSTHHRCLQRRLEIANSTT